MTNTIGSKTYDGRAFSTARLAVAPLQGRPISRATLSGMIQLVEVLGLSLVGLVLAALWVGSADAFSDGRYLIAIGMAAGAAVLVFSRLDLYSVPALSNTWPQIPRLMAGWTTALALLVAGVFMLKVGVEFSRGWLLLWLAFGLLLSASLRLAVAGHVRDLLQAGHLVRRAVVFGGGKEGAELIAALEADPDNDLRICGLFDDRGADRIPESIRCYPLLGTTEELISFCRSNEVDLLIVSLPLTAESRLLQILKRLWVLPIDIRLAAHANQLRFRPRAYSYLGSVPLIDVFDKPIAGWNNTMKSAFDKIVATLALIVLSPVMLAVAIAVRLDSKGPILFRQKRLGFNNQSVDVWKFRSMYTDMADAAATKLVTKDDPRVTRVGRFIRKTSLDELPQLFNVLSGTLSLVGPRPHALQAKAANELYQDVVDGYFARHKVKPGITGWAQVNGWRGETDTAEKIQQRVAHDLYYIENWSLLLDIEILAKTPLALLKSENAY